MDGLMALDSAGSLGLGDVALLYRGSSGEGRRPRAPLQPGVGQDPDQTGKVETTERRPAAHGTVATVTARC